MRNGVRLATALSGITDSHHLYPEPFISDEERDVVDWRRQYRRAERCMGSRSVPSGAATGGRGLCERRAGGASQQAGPRLDPSLHPCLDPRSQAHGQSPCPHASCIPLGSSVDMGSRVMSAEMSSQSMRLSGGPVHQPPPKGSLAARSQ